MFFHSLHSCGLCFLWLTIRQYIELLRLGRCFRGVDKNDSTSAHSTSAVSQPTSILLLPENRSLPIASGAQLINRILKVQPGGATQFPFLRGLGVNVKHTDCDA